MEYFNGSTANGVVRLLWSSASTPKQLVPQTQLYPTGATDTDPPTATVSNPITDGGYRTLTQATGTAFDAGSGVQQVRAVLYRYADNTYWNGTAWTATLAENAAAKSAPTGGTVNWTYSLPALSQGRYAVQAVATDNAGLKSSSAWVPFYIDNVAPTITINRPTAGTQYSTIGSAAGNTADSLSGVAWVRGRLVRASDGFYWTGSTWVATLTEVRCQGTTIWGYYFPALASGNYSWQVLASDKAGNISSSAPVNFTKVP
jgi:hypothetical protein